MPFTKQAAFTKKATDLPDKPSPAYTATDIKAHFQTPADELKTTVNQLITDLESNTGATNVGAKNGAGVLSTVQGEIDKNRTDISTHKSANELDHPDASVTTRKLANGSVTREKVATGAIGTNELDPAIFSQPTTVEGVQAKFQSVDEQLVEKDAEFKKIDYKINNQEFNKNRMIRGLTSNGESGHFSSFSHTALYDGIMTMNNSNSAWLNFANSRPWVKASMPIIVTIGDSISEGHPNAHGRLHRSNGSVDLTALNEVGQLSYHIEQYTKLKTYNHGIGGQTSDQVRARWHRDVLAETDAGLTPTNTLPKKPICVVLVVGINDVFGGRTIEQISTDMEYMIDNAITNNIYPIVFNIGPHASMDTTKLTVVKGVNSWLVEKEKNTPSMKLIDFYEYANDPNNDGKPKTGYFPDGVHPTKYHYERLARKVIDEALTEQHIPVVPRFINFSSAFDFTAFTANIGRPTSCLVFINDEPKQYYILPNSPDQCIPIPFTAGYIETIKVQILTQENAYEASGGTGAYVGWAELYLTDRNIFSEKENAIVYEGNDSTIIKVPCDSVGFAAFRAAIPSVVTPGSTTVANAGNMTNVIGTFVEATASNAYICTQGICMIQVDVAVYKGDFLVTTGTAGICTRATSPTVGSIVAEVLVGTTGAGYALCRRR